MNGITVRVIRSENPEMISRLYARIIKVTDSYDAMISKRPGREQLSPADGNRIYDGDGGSRI